MNIRAVGNIGTGAWTTLGPTLGTTLGPTLGTLLGLLLATAALVLAPSASAVGTADGTLIIAGGKLISGAGDEVLENTVIYIRDGSIERIDVSPDADYPQGPHVISARGKYLVPGLIESHGHIDHVNGLDLTQEQARLAREYNPQAFLYHGVTTVINMSSRELAWVKQLQREASAGAVLPRILTGGEHFTAKGGWGGRHGGGVDTLAEVNERMAEAAAAKVDLVKIIYEDGLGENAAFKRLEPELLDEIVRSGRQQRLPVFIHATDGREYADAIAAGPTALAHGLVTSLDAGSPIIAGLLERKLHVVPTLVLFEAFTRFLDAPELLQDPFLRASVPDFVLHSVSNDRQLRRALDQMSSILKMDAAQWARRSMSVLQENTRRFAAAGVPLAVGADSGGAVPHAFQGYNTPREMELLAECCLSPMATITAATRSAAEMMGRGEQFGTLRPGMAADILILNSDPLVDMRNIRDFDRMVLRGMLLERSSLTAAAFMKNAARVADPASNQLEANQLEANCSRRTGSRHERTLPPFTSH